MNAEPVTRPRDETIAAFRQWLRARVEGDPRSLNYIEREAAIKGNAVGKFIRGERGGQLGLSPLQISRLAPVLGVSEEMMLSKAGHLSHEPDSISVEGAILADPHLQYEDKRFLIEFYRRLVRTQPTESSTAA